MPAWIHVYCREVVDPIEPGLLREALKGPDWHALAAQVDLENDEVDAWLQGFAARAGAEPDTIEFGSGADLDLILHRITRPHRLTEGSEEAQERLEDLDGVVVRRLRAHVVAMEAMLSFEVAWSALDGPAALVAHEMALWAAERWGGLVLTQDECWIDPSVSRTEALLEPA